MYNYAIVLAGGNGSRMNSPVPKQYMEIEGKTILFYTLDFFEQCRYIDEIILVTRKQDMDFCKENYHFDKLKHYTEGGSERYESVINGLKFVENEGYVYIHDGARPCLTDDLIERLNNDVEKYKAVVPATPAKETVRISDDNGNSVMTPPRKNVWMIQTPQVFESSLIKNAYTKFKETGTSKNITDDAMIIEEFTDVPIHITLGDYANIKITTAEDMPLAEQFVKKIKKVVDIRKPL